jgi:hypothetical protein
MMGLDPRTRRTETGSNNPLCNKKNAYFLGRLCVGFNKPIYLGSLKPIIYGCPTFSGSWGTFMSPSADGSLVLSARSLLALKKVAACLFYLKQIT